MEKNEPIRDQTGVARQRVMAYLFVGAGLTLCHAFMRGTTWHGSATLHTVMEAVATLLALIVGAMALVRFYSRKNNTFLFIGAGFLGTAFLDGYHALVTSAAFKPFMPSDLPALIPWSWVASRQFLSVFLFLSFIAWLREHRLGDKGRIGERSVYMFTGVFALASFTFFAFAPLPRAYYPELVFHRPEEFLPALFFLAALVGYLHKGHWRHDTFEHWLVLSLVVGFVGQAVFMSFSGELFDLEFDAAHLLKKVSYVCVLTGLLASMYVTFRREAERGETMAKAKENAEAALAMLDRREAELVAQNERFNTALDNMSQGLCMFDGEQRLIVANERYASMYGLSFELMKPGTTFREILEYRIANDIYAGQGHEDYIQERLTAVLERNPSTKFQELSDGRFVAISHCPMSGGGWLATHEDVTERKRAEEALMESEARFRAVFDNTPVCLNLKDTEGRYLFANKRYEEWWGRSAEEVIGKKAHEFQADAFGVETLTAAEKVVLETGAAYESEISVKRPQDGQIYDRLLIKFPVKSPDGLIMGLGTVAVDITERKQAEAELTRHRDHLQELVGAATKELKNKADELTLALAKEQELNKLQREFVSMASHEFRTPLAIIDATAQRMKSRADKNRLTPEDAVRRVEKIRAAVGRMTQLMESTLDAARLEEGKIRVEIKPCDIGKVVQEVCARQQEIAQTHVISCDLASLPDTIEADEGALEQVLANLLSNAVKYALDAPDIEIKARTEGDQVVISVRDHGLGIDEDELERIGERFFRARTSTGIAGTGIGLYMAKTLVEMHGGTVSVESKKGEGSTFTIRLPIAGPDQTEQADTRAA